MRTPSIQSCSGDVHPMGTSKAIAQHRHTRFVCVEREAARSLIEAACVYQCSCVWCFWLFLLWPNRCRASAICGDLVGSVSCGKLPASAEAAALSCFHRRSPEFRIMLYVYRANWPSASALLRPRTHDIYAAASQSQSQFIGWRSSSLG